MKLFFSTLFIIMLSFFSHVKAQQLDGFKYRGAPHSFEEPAIEDNHQFNNYTTHWLNDYQRWYRYGNLFKMSIPDIQKTLLQSKINLAEDMGLPGLFL